MGLSTFRASERQTALVLVFDILYRVHIGTQSELSQTKQKEMVGKQRHRATKLRLEFQVPEDQFN